MSRCFRSFVDENELKYVCIVAFIIMAVVVMMMMVTIIPDFGVLFSRIFHFKHEILFAMTKIQSEV